MINVIIWSKNRAAQLDLTLTTLKKHFMNWWQQTYTIIYKYTTETHRLSYEKIKQLHPEFNYVLETNFRNDTINAVMNSNKEFTSFLVDDDIFVDNFSLNSEEFNEFVNNSSIICLSPRMAPYINFCYTQNAPAPTPALDEKRRWNWIGQPGDWGYPASVSALHIFRKIDIINPILSIPFTGPNTFEGICLAPNMPAGRPLMICYEHAKCICSTNTRVQVENNNIFANTHSLDDLVRCFLNGHRLDPNANENRTLNMCHGPLTIRWAK